MAYIGNKPSEIGHFPSELYNGTGSQTDFTLPVEPGVEAALLIFIDGVRQATNTFSIVSGTTLRFSTAPPSGTNNIEVVILGTLLNTGVPADTSVTLAKLSSGTGSSGQYLTTDGSSTLSWSTVSSTPDLTTEGDLYKNYTSITSDLTTPVDADSNQGLIGPITITADWTVAGDVTIW